MKRGLLVPNKVVLDMIKETMLAKKSVSKQFETKFGYFLETLVSMTLIVPELSGVGVDEDGNEAVVW